jgi:hypothetical protein
MQTQLGSSLIGMKHLRDERERLQNRAHIYALMVSGSVLISEYKDGENGCLLATMAVLKFSLPQFPLMSDSDRQRRRLIG